MAMIKREREREESRTCRTVLLHGLVEQRHRARHDVVAAERHGPRPRLGAELHVERRVARRGAVRRAAEALGTERPLQAPRPPPRPLHRPHGAPREHRARDRRPHKHQRPLVTCGEDDHPHRSSHSLAYRSSYPRSQSSLLPATAITRSAAVRSRKRRGELIGGMLTTGCLLLCLSAHHPAVIYIYKSYVQTRRVRGLFPGPYYCLFCLWNICSGLLLPRRFYSLWLACMSFTGETWKCVSGTERGKKRRSENKTCVNSLTIDVGRCIHISVQLGVK